MSSIIFAKLDPAFFRNRKIMEAGRNGAIVFLAALCMNADRGAPGWIPLADLKPWFLSRYIGWLSEDEARDGVTKACNAKLLTIEDDRVVLVGWSGEWARRPMTRAEIQKGYRDRKRESSGSRYDDSVTRDHGSNALPIRGEERRGERGDGNALSLGLGPGDPAAECKAARLPKQWSPSTEAVALARELGLDATQEAAKFADRMRSGERKSADWHAEFRNWLRRGAEFHARTGKRKVSKPGATTTEARADVVFTEQGAVPADVDVRSRQREISTESQQGSDPRKRGK